MSSNTPRSPGNKSQATQESAPRYFLRKRPSSNVSGTKDHTAPSTSSISGQQATSHSKLRKTSSRVTGSKPASPSVLPPSSQSEIANNSAAVPEDTSASCIASNSGQSATSNSKLGKTSNKVTGSKPPASPPVNPPPPQHASSSGIPVSGRVPSRGNSFLGSLMPRMQHLLAGNSGILGHSVNLMQTSNGRYASMMEGLRSSNEIRQAEAANELAEILLMGNEETLPNLPIREIVQLLNLLMQRENNLELTLTAVRCITNMQEALPRAMPVLAETVPTLLQKLKHIECIDIAEQTLVALEVLSRRNAKCILHAGGFADAVMHVDFFSMPSQRLVYQIAANCAFHINGTDFPNVKPCFPDLVQKITCDDKRCCESVCAFFSRMIDNSRNHSDRLRDIAGKNYEFLAKVQQLFMIQPSTISSETFLNLLRAVRLMCLKCSEVVSALINMEFGRTLRFLLVGTDREGASVDITSRPAQHMREIISLTSELLPPLPKIELFEISSTVVQYMNNTVPLSANNSAVRDEDGVSITWQFEEEMGIMVDFPPEATAMLETKRVAGATESVIVISNTPCVIDLVDMTYNNPQTGFIGRIDRRITAGSPDQQEDLNADRDITREKHNKRLVDLISILFHILVEIGSATSCSNLRYEATRAMIRMMYAVESETQLRAILHNLPLAGYIASTLSSNKGHSVTVSVLQLVHVILDKLPRLYVPLFESEGVFFMIEKLIKDEIKPEASPTKVINLRRGPIEVPTANTPSIASSTVAAATAAAAAAAAAAASGDLNFSDSISVSSLSSMNSNISEATSMASGSTSSHVSRNNTEPNHAVLIQPDGSRSIIDARQLLAPAFNSMIYPPPQLSTGPVLQMNYHSHMLQNLSQELSMVMQQAGSSSGQSNMAIATAFKQAVVDRIINWISKEAKYLISTYHGNDAIYELDQTVVKELNRIAALFAKTNETGFEPLEALKKIMKSNAISAFQLNHSNVIRNLATYLIDSSEDRKPHRSIRLTRFLKVFANMTEDNLRPIDLNGEMFAPFERLVSKIVHAVGQLEQFQIKLSNLSGIVSESNTGHNVSTVLRGSNALRFFQTHQIRCNLRRHPSCKQLREWRHGRGSIKVDPFTSVSAIERYLVDRGIGNTVASESSSDNEDGSEDDPDVASNESTSSSQQPFTGKIEILIGDTPVPSDLSILQAIRQYSLSQEDDQEVIPPSVWINAHTLYFRIAPTETNNDEASSSSAAAASGSAKKSRRSGGTRKSAGKPSKPLIFTSGEIPSRKDPLEFYLQAKLESEFNDPCYDSCVLLRVLYGLNKFWWTLFDEKCPKTHDPILPSSVFHSSKMNSKVQRQLSDFLSVATQQVPKWTINIVHAVPFIFSFVVRRNLLYCTSFGRDRALMHLVTEGNDEHDGEATNRLIPRLERRKVTVKRNNLLSDAISTFHQMNTSKAQLEVNFDGEVGTGFGPTLEFYSTVSREIQKHNLGLWAGQSQPFSFGEGNDVEDYTVAENGLYPNAINRATKNAKIEGRTKRFEFIGRLLAQALLDSRMLDIPLSPIFFKWLLNEEDTICAYDMEKLDRTFYKSLRAILATEEAKDFKSLEQYFTMPGDDSFELLKGGKNIHITKENVHQFVDLVVYWRLVEGVREEMLSLRRGFEQVIDPNILKIFACEEMEELFCGCSESSLENDRIWSKTALQQVLRPDHGYTHESPQIIWLVEMIHSFNLEDRRKFLQFCTGSPRLPVGGFKSLNPPLTVVRKTVSYGNVETELPSAMTCYNFLKIPPYASYETFVERFLVALQFIYSFHLT